MGNLTPFRGEPHILIWIWCCSLLLSSTKSLIQPISFHTQFLESGLSKSGNSVWSSVIIALVPLFLFLLFEAEDAKELEKITSGLVPTEDIMLAMEGMPKAEKGSDAVLAR